MSDAPGLTKLDALREGGYDEAAVMQWRNQATDTLREGGYDEDAIRAYWGDPKEAAPTDTLAKGVRDNVRNGGIDLDHLNAADPNSWSEMWDTGWQWSSGGLASGSIPQHAINENAPLVPWLIQTAGGLTGDAPAMVVGGVGGFLGGTAAGLETGPAAPAVGAAVGWAGASALPAWIREYYLDGLRNGEYKDFYDFVSRNAGIMWEGTKAGAVGAVEGASGVKTARFVGPIVTKGAGAILGDAAGVGLGRTAALGSEVAAWATTGATAAAALEGRLPTQREFEDALIVGGMTGILMPGAHLIASSGRKIYTALGEQYRGKMQDVFRDTGMHPNDLVRTANDNPVVRQALNSTTADGETPVDMVRPYAPPEPRVEKPAAEEKPGEVAPPDEGPLNEAQRAMEETKPISVPSGAEHSGETSLPSRVDNVSPHRLLPALKGEKMFDDQTGMRVKVNDPDKHEKLQLEKLREILPKFKNEDGTLDVESALAAYHAGHAKASLFRNSGRDYSKLPMETRRFLERVGDFIDNEQGGFEPAPPSEAMKKAQQALEEQTAAAQEAAKVRAAAKKFNEQQTMQEVSNATPVATLAQNLSHPVIERPRKTFRDMYNRARYKWSKFYPAQVFDSMFQERTAYGIGLDGMMRLWMASGGKFARRVNTSGLMKGKDQFGNDKYVRDPRVPAARSIYQEAEDRPGGLAEFDAVQSAMHELDLSKLEGYKPGPRLYDAQALIRAVGPKWKDLLDQDRLVRDSVIERAIDAGLVEKEEASRFRVEHPNWHPFVDNAQAEKFQRIHDWEYEAGLNEARKFGAEILDKNGYLKNHKVEMKEEEELPTAFDYGKPPSIKPVRHTKTIEWHDGGFKHTAEISDALPMRQYFTDMLMNDDFMHPFGLEKFLRHVAGFTRTWILSMPLTVLRILYKDGLQAFILNKDGGMFVKNTFTGVLALIDDIASKGIDRKTGALSRVGDYEVNGGYAMAINGLDGNQVMREIRKAKLRSLSSVPNIRAAIAGVHDFVRNTDAATRIGGVFRIAGEKEGTVPAAIKSRLLHGDFAEPSTSRSLHFITQILPFSQAKFRGDYDANIRAIKADPVGVAARGGLVYGMLVAVGYALAVKFEKDHPDMPDSQKFRNLPWYQRYLNIHVNFKLGDEPGQGYHVIPFPTAWGIGEIFHGAITSFMDHWYDTDQKGLEHYSDALLREFGMDNPLFDSPFLKPFLETWANKDREYGSPIVTQGEAYRSGWRQFDNNTSETAKMLSYYLGPPGIDAADWSPKYIDKFIDDWTGQTGLKVLKGLEAPYKEYVQNPKDWYAAVIAREKDVFLGTAILRLNANAQPINEFYDLYDRVNKVHADYNRADKEGDEDTKIKSMSSPEWQVDAKQLRQTSKALADFRLAAIAINNNTDMTVIEKNQALDNLASIMIAAARNSVELTKAMLGEK